MIQIYQKKLFRPILGLFVVLFVLTFGVGIICNSLLCGYLSFSDAAKFADIARNVVQGKGFVTNYSFFDKGVVDFGGSFPASFTPPAMPYAIAMFFKLFGISDASVIATSAFFFILTVIFTYLLAKELFGKTVGVLASSIVLINQTILDYAKTGASETLFMFEIVAIPYLMLLKKRWATVISYLLLVISYFTRPQAFIFIAAYILFYLLINFKTKKALFGFAGILLIGLILDRLILLPLYGKYFLYSITARGTHAVTQHTQYNAVSDVLRGVGEQPSSMLLTIKKAGTNLFNFYRSLPNILNPYIFTFFILSSLVFFKKREEKAFLITAFFCATLSFLLPALTIPFYRYIHPVLPLIYIVGIAALVSILSRISNFEFLISCLRRQAKQIPMTKIHITKRNIAVALSSLFVFIFFILMQVGVFIHDYKYFEARRNYNKPPVYVVLSEILKENTSEDDLVVTNLDTWGSWYGERKTVWFPLEPDMLNVADDTAFDAIYLTSYLMNDENYFMGDEWRQIFENPENIKDEFIRENYIYAGEFEVGADEVYEKYGARSVLLIRKT